MMFSVLIQLGNNSCELILADVDFIFSSVVTANRAPSIYASWKLANSSYLAGLQTLTLLKEEGQGAAPEDSSQNRKKGGKRVGQRQEAD